MENPYKGENKKKRETQAKVNSSVINVFPDTILGVLTSTGIVGLSSYEWYSQQINSFLPESPCENLHQLAVSRHFPF